MAYIQTTIAKSSLWRIREGLNKTQCIAQLLAMAFRPSCFGFYIVIFERDDAHGYQWGMNEDDQYDAVVDLVKEHKNLTINKN